jgi:general nucleoside transport system permease protein
VSGVAAPAVSLSRLDVRWVGVGGIVLGILAVWLTLPPVELRSAGVPIAFGICAAATGIFVATRGYARVGWGAVAAGLIGILLGLLSLQSGLGHLKVVFSWGGLISATLVYATPLTFGALGGMFSERSGVVNIALEGMMLVGAFFGIWGAVATGNWLLGLLIGMGMGGVFAFIHALWAIHLRADQIVGGTAINFLAVGVTGYFFIQIYGDEGTPNLSTGHWLRGESIPDVHIPGLQGGGFFSQVLGGLNLMIWLSFALLVISYFVLFKTAIGLRIRAVGEHPRAADTVGIDVYRTRYAAVIVSGMLAAMGGAYLSIGFTHSFNQDMTEGRGFIALAALIFGKWRPFGAFAAALLFGFSSALAQVIPSAYSDSSYSVLSSSSLFLILPYVLTLVAVAGVIGRSIAPAADGQPYVKQ